MLGITDVDPKKAAHGTAEICVERDEAREGKLELLARRCRTFRHALQSAGYERGSRKRMNGNGQPSGPA
jgi:hypothetical protein